MRLPHGGNGRDLHAGWQSPADARIALWRLEGHGPEGELRKGEVARPPLILRDLAVGDWRLRLKAVDWSGREGPALEAVFTVKADAVTPEPPRDPAIIPGYGQIIITWDRSNLPADALVEVCEYTSKMAATPHQVTSTQGAVHILPGRSPGLMAYFRLRTRLAGGTVSALGVWLEAAAETLPAPQEAGRAPQFQRVKSPYHAGHRRRHARPLTVLIPLPVILSRSIARYRRSIRPGPKPGDMTGRHGKNPKPCFQVMCWRGNGQRVTAQVDPDQLEATTADDQLRIKAISADLITEGVMQSSDYVAGETGFRIDTSGSAEFNNARIRGALNGATIRSSLLVAATQTIPTEAAADGGRFLTLDRPRALRYARRNQSGNVLTIGPMQVATDTASRHIGDHGNIILAGDDPHGDTNDGDNLYFSRFWARAPQFRLGLTHRVSGTPWGEHVTHGYLKVKIRTESGRKLAESGLMRIDQLRSWQQTTANAARSWILPLSGGFRPGSILTLSREVRHEFLKAPRPGVISPAR